jgi:hypothetical protein
LRPGPLPLPTAPELVHTLLDSKANWVRVPQAKQDQHLDGFPDESLEDWHRRHGLLEGPNGDVPG